MHFFYCIYFLTTMSYFWVPWYSAHFFKVSYCLVKYYILVKLLIVDKGMLVLKFILNSTITYNISLESDALLIYSSVLSLKKAWNLLNIKFFSGIMLWRGDSIYSRYYKWIWMYEYMYIKCPYENTLYCTECNRWRHVFDSWKPLMRLFDATYRMCSSLSWIRERHQRTRRELYGYILFDCKQRSN